MTSFEIENIDELRLREGIDDVELHEDIDRLRVGDHVRLTFMAGASQRETFPVRITSIRAGQFRGRVIGRASRLKSVGLRADALVAFSAGHIHSIAAPPLAPTAGRGKRRR